MSWTLYARGARQDQCGSGRDSASGGADLTADEKSRVALLGEGGAKVIVFRSQAQVARRLVGRRGIQLVRGEEPLIGFTKNLMIFRKSGLLLTSRLMEGNYPNYQQVVPKESGKRIVVNRGLLESALRRVSVLSKDKANAVKLSFAPGGMTLFSSNPDYGEATEELAARYEGEALHTGFNARYLLDALSVMDGESVSLQMDTALSPCLIQEAESPGFKCVVMPIKI